MTDKLYDVKPLPLIRSLTHTHSLTHFLSIEVPGIMFVWVYHFNRLINTLLKNTGGSPVTFSKKITSPFVAMGNLENFSKGCEAFGLPRTCIIQSGDVYEGNKAKFYNVLNTLHSLAMLVSFLHLSDGS